jgi:hypothetical protein
MMRLKVQTVFEATQVLANIINENRPLPTKGKFLVKRMHTTLFPDFTTANDQRTAKITSYENQNEAGDPAVPDDKMNEFVAWWAELAGVEIDVNVSPIPIGDLCIAGADSPISFAEFGVLGELVAE